MKCEYLNAQAAERQETQWKLFDGINELKYVTFWRRKYFFQHILYMKCEYLIAQAAERLETPWKLFDGNNELKYLTFWRRNYFFILAHPVYEM